MQPVVAFAAARRFTEAIEAAVGHRLQIFGEIKEAMGEHPKEGDEFYLQGAFDFFP